MLTYRNFNETLTTNQHKKNLKKFCSLVNELFF